MKAAFLLALGLLAAALGLLAACSRSDAGEPDLHVAVIHVGGMQKSATGAT